MALMLALISLACPREWRAKVWARMSQASLAVVARDTRGTIVESNVPIKAPKRS